MFRNWGFLLVEIWLLVALAAVFGLLCGWLIWGRGARLMMPALSLGSGPTPSKPALLDDPRGVADDLKAINGIGPALADLCHSMGIWHFAQIAAWTPAEVAWVDANLPGFKGRVSRDDWVGQAKKLMENRPE